MGMNDGQMSFDAATIGALRAPWVNAVRDLEDQIAAEHRVISRALDLSKELRKTIRAMAPLVTAMDDAFMTTFMNDPRRAMVAYVLDAMGGIENVKKVMGTNDVSIKVAEGTYHVAIHLRWETPRSASSEGQRVLTRRLWVLPVMEAPDQPPKARITSMGGWSTDPMEWSDVVPAIENAFGVSFSERVCLPTAPTEVSVSLPYELAHRAAEVRDLLQSREPMVAVTVKVGKSPRRSK